MDTRPPDTALSVKPNTQAQSSSAVLPTATAIVADVWPSSPTQQDTLASKHTGQHAKKNVLRTDVPSTCTPIRGAYSIWRHAASEMGSRTATSDRLL